MQYNKTEIILIKTIAKYLDPAGQYCPVTEKRNVLLSKALKEVLKESTGENFTISLDENLEYNQLKLDESPFYL